MPTHLSRSPTAKREGLHFVEVRNAYEVQCVCGGPRATWGDARAKWGDFEDDVQCVACAKQMCDEMDRERRCAAGSPQRGAM